MKIYIASSWKNQHAVEMLTSLLREKGSGIAIFESEFLANIVLPDGSTVGDRIIPKVAEAYKEGKMPQLLLGGVG